MTISKKEMVARIITALFIAYGKKDDTDRIALYCQMFMNVPPDILQAVTHKAMMESEYVPSIAKLMEMSRSLVGSMDESKRIKPWAEAQKEIQEGLRKCWYHGCMGEIPDTDPNYGKSCGPMWSTPEIQETVDSYGYENIGNSLEVDMPTVWSQLRRIYEQVCNRKQEKEVNTLVINEKEKELKTLVGRVSNKLALGGKK